ncbi:putative pyridoxal-phosphate dependent enzyme [Lyophyllum shimeji]|uniref:Pyridoxal-phosphate dependent enzyme n=1 Tax=Lyophyllum shimeji TaxID=47721 RepID=A0A9P3PN81_LYOSH|nr:putative pyridoxal-phosphate dependent enzyme [Lyophyllum shimeji]
MADVSLCLPLTRESVQSAYDFIRANVHKTPVLTSRTLNGIASTQQATSPDCAKPSIRLFFKCENYQKIGAFKARGAFHALLRLFHHLGEDEVRRRGVVTHSSGNHAQALAFAAHTYNVPAHIVMPSISTASKIAGTKSHGANVVFSGSTSEEREAVVAQVIRDTGAILVPPYDHPDIILGQGTAALEFEEKVGEMQSTPLDAVITPLGGGGLLSGTATYFAPTSTRVFGAEPSFQGADDGRRGLEAGKRVESIKTLTIADGLRTPVGLIPWTVISDREKVAGLYSVSEDQIKEAMKLVLERMKVVIEPSAAVPLAVVLFNEEFRKLVEREAGEKGWDIGVIFSGGNTTVEAIAKLFS